MQEGNTSKHKKLTQMSSQILCPQSEGSNPTGSRMPVSVCICIRIHPRTPARLRRSTTALSVRPGCEIPTSSPAGDIDRRADYPARQWHTPVGLLPVNHSTSTAKGERTAQKEMPDEGKEDEENLSMGLHSLPYRIRT